MRKLLFVLLTTLLLSCEKELGGTDTPINVPSSTTLSGSINQTITLTSDKVWVLKGYVYITDGAQLIIQPGTIIKSDIAEKGALCIERGAKIIAEGTEDKPIVFTSGQPDGQKTPGDWGGIVILGRATTNRSSEPTIEGGIGRTYGGNDDNDNSGILKYVRIEYAGVAAMPNSEINGLTLGAVGSGTIIDYVQTIYANDDAFEFFGGTVSPKHLYAYGTADDDYDFDFGFRGTLSYSISKRDPQFVDNADAGNGVESDNDGTGSQAQPYTHPKLNYITLIGPNDPNALSNHNFAMRWRRSSRFEVTNSTFVGYMKGGLSIESVESAQFYKDNISTFRNNTISAYDPNLNFRANIPNVLTALQLKEKALTDGNIEKTFTQNEINLLSRPQWTDKWTRFPTKGN